MTKCDSSMPSQVWQFDTGGVTTNVKSGGPSKGCWEITGCNTKPGAAVGTGYGCKPLPKNGCGNTCFCNGAWQINKTDYTSTPYQQTNAVNTVTFHSVMDGACLQVSGSEVNMGPCVANDNKQHFVLETVEDGRQSVGIAPPPPTYRVSQGGRCVDDRAKPSPPKPIPPPCNPPYCTLGGPANVTMSLTLLDLGITGKVKVRDVWNKKTLPSLASSEARFTTSVPHHGCTFYVFMPETAKWPEPFKRAPWMDKPAPPVPP